MWSIASLKTFKKLVKNMSYHQSKSDQCLYFDWEGDVLVVLVAWVGDIMILGRESSTQP
jgi:hypothetical protein